jgi:pimeloyl-ACP methyl ester carboxylesterase
MNHPSFEEVQNQIQQHYQNGEYDRALELSTRMAASFPDQAPLFYYWRICMTARLGEIQESLRLLQEVLDQGIWYGEVLLRRSPSLQPLQELPAFQELVEQNLRLQAHDQEGTFPLITLRPQGECEAGGLPCPLLIALHGNGSSAQASVNFWSPAASEGWLVAVPQSTQAMWKDSYVWNDLEAAREEIQRHMASLVRQYSVDPAFMLAAGHSMGGEVAMWLSLTGAIPTNGFVAIGPGGPLMEEPGSWQPIIDGSAGRDLRGYVIIGEKDDLILRENLELLVDRLSEGGIPCDLEIVPDAGHDFMVGYESALLRGLDYVTQREE